MTLKTIKCGNLTYLHPNDKFAYYVPYMAKLQYGFLKLKEGDIVVDVGAFPGDFTLHASQLVGDSGIVIAIEPNPENFRILKLNVMYNKLGNVILINKAISNKKGTTFLIGTGVSASISSVTSGQSVETISMDQLLEELGLKPDVVKIDVEGHEQEVLDGFRLLAEAREVAIETHSLNSFKNVLRRLMKDGFQIYVLNNNMLVINFILHVVPYLSDFVTSEIKSKFLMSRLLIKYFFGLIEHPAPACRSREFKVIYGIKKR